ncbi:MAG TPA: bifunctional diguanylate cyclase/phosphodiesterase [Clostridium sp.]
MIDSQYEAFVTEELEIQCNELQEKNKKIHFLTYYDNLTKLPNKNYFVEQLENLISSKAEDNKFVLFFINIDNLKSINTVHGHDYGDKILLLISEVLKIVLPQESILCKWHGDEFIIIIEDLKGKQEVIDIAENIINYIRNPFEIGEKQIYITISIGINIYHNESSSINDIIKNVEVAMYKAKKNGKNGYSFYNDELRKNIYRNNDIRKQLGNALYNNELYLNYQPQYDITTENVIGYEALLRWDNNELGKISPVEFIPIAEENGLIFTLGNWVLLNACIQNCKWIALGYYNIIAVNVSAIQFEQDNFVQTVKDILSETKLLPQFLELEITENILINSLEKSVKTIEKLKELGVRVSLDDFGTGYSSLSYLKKLPINNLKIDKTFIDDIVISQDSKSILEAIVQLAHTLNLEVIAEGIETSEQSRILKEIKCDIAQGYYYNKPISSEEIEKVLTSNYFT